MRCYYFYDKTQVVVVVVIIIILLLVVLCFAMPYISNIKWQGFLRDSVVVCSSVLQQIPGFALFPIWQKAFGIVSFGDLLKWEVFFRLLK